MRLKKQAKIEARISDQPHIPKRLLVFQDQIAASTGGSLFCAVRHPQRPETSPRRGVYIVEGQRYDFEAVLDESGLKIDEEPLRVEELKATGVVWR